MNEIYGNLIFREKWWHDKLNIEKPIADETLEINWLDVCSDPMS